MKNYAEKYRYLYAMQGGVCPISKKPLPVLAENIGAGMQGVETADLHHRNPDKKWRRKARPLFHNSVLNLVLLDHLAHLSNGRYAQITDHNADEIERVLERSQTVSSFVNKPKIPQNIAKHKEKLYKLFPEILAKRSMI